MNGVIIQDIDQILDQLIRNAEAIHHIELNDLTDFEREAFEKTQESLLQNLLRADAALKNPKPSSEKRRRFEELKSSYTQRAKLAGSRRPIVAKRQGKQFFDLRARRRCEI
ncbi:MAG TPA: hypothetical protein VGM34_00435 [Chlamydiales bacterium]